jgi:aryl-alcohol dehydrogenase-like predicted oxidoreductase
LASLPADDWRREKNRHFQEPLFSRNLQLAALLGEIGRPHGKSPGEVAIAWTLNHPAVTAAIVGARKPGQMKGLIGAADWRLPPDALSQIDEFLKAHPDPG